MATELRPGTFSMIFLKMDAQMKIRARKALTELALVIEKQAKVNARNGSHKYGTKTPAMPDQGPAVISGTLRRSITHTPVKRVGIDFECKVGMAPGFFPNYGNKTTSSSKYAYYLENKMLKGGIGYPFLLPAYKFGTGVPARLIYNKAFGSNWKVIG